MTVTPPTIGQEDWGDDLNAYLIDLENRIAANVARIVELEEQVAELEARKEHIYNSYPWKFSAAAPPAAAGELRLNHVDPAQATSMDFRKIDGDGADRANVFATIQVDDIIRVTDWDDASAYHRFHVAAAPTIDATNVTVPVTWISGAGTLPTVGAAKINVGFLLSLIV